MSEDFDPIKSELEPKEPDTETELELDDSLKDYVLEKGREEYLEPETSGMDRL